jgi:hypothetical protein
MHAAPLSGAHTTRVIAALSPSFPSYTRFSTNFMDADQLAALTARKSLALTSSGSGF